mgnify:FL=1
MPMLSIVLMIWLTIVRHEGSHALVAWMQGVPINAVRLFPGYDPELGFYSGYVSRGDGGTWLIDAAPFLAAVAWFIAGFYLLLRLPRKSGWWLPLFLIGAISPLADLIYNYQGGFWREGTDVWDLFRALPDPLVHIYFLGAIALCLLGIRRLRADRRAGPV